MDKYTASNGVIIHEQDGHVSLWSREGGVLVVGSGDFGTALKEYVNHVREEAISQRAEEVQAKRDFELGRWRWPEDRDVFVRPIEGDADYVEVNDEASGESTSFRRSTMDAEGSGDWYLTRAARAYFDAHPEAKPWHAAKPGEVWALKIGVSDEEEIVQARDELFVNIGAEPRWFDTAGKRAPEIAAGRRIWPEEVS